MSFSGHARQILTQAYGLLLDAKDVLKDGNEQNRCVDDYLTPLITLDVGTVRKNWRKNRQDSAVRRSEQAGVYDSLKRLEEEGTSWDKIYNPMVEIVMADFNRHQKIFNMRVDLATSSVYWDLKSKDIMERMDAYRELHPAHECYNVVAAPSRDRMSALLRIHASELGPIPESNLPVYRPKGEGKG